MINNNCILDRKLVNYWTEMYSYGTRIIIVCVTFMANYLILIYRNFINACRVKIVFTRYAYMLKSVFFLF